MRNQFTIKDLTDIIELNKTENRKDGLSVSAFIGSQVKERKEVGQTKTFIMSMEIKDRDGDVVKLSGGNIDYYNQNPIVAWSHETRRSYMDLMPYNPDNIIGKGKAYFDGAKLMNDIEFEPKEINPLAWKIESKIAFGSINAGSIGFMPFDGHMGNKERGEDSNTFYITDWELLEYSIVPIPSNRAALITSSYKEEKEGNETIPEPVKIKRSTRVARARLSLLTY